MSIKLYDLTQAYQNILELIDDEQDSDLAKALQAVEGEIEVKAVNIANLIKSLESEAEIIKAEEERLAQRRKARENAVARIKEYLKENLETLGMEKIKTPTRTIYVQDNPPAVNIIDPDRIPERFLTLTLRYEPRKKDIIEAWKAGEEIPGVEITRGKGVRIK